MSEYCVYSMCNVLIFFTLQLQTQIVQASCARGRCEETASDRRSWSCVYEPMLCWFTYSGLIQNCKSWAAKGMLLEHWLCSCLNCAYISLEHSNCTVQSMTSDHKKHQSNDQNHLHKRSLHKEQLDRKELGYKTLVTLAQRACWCYGWGFCWGSEWALQTIHIGLLLGTMSLWFCHCNLDTKSLMPAMQI